MGETAKTQLNTPFPDITTKGCLAGILWSKTITTAKSNAKQNALTAGLPMGLNDRKTGSANHLTEPKNGVRQQRQMSGCWIREPEARAIRLADRVIAGEMNIELD